MTGHRVLGRRALVLGSGLVLSGCGFHPVYGTRGDVAGSSGRELSTIRVALMSERSGQLLRQALQQRMDGHDTGLPKKYELTANFSISIDVIGIQADSTATRARESATAKWILKRLDGNQATVTEGTARTLDGMNMINQQYFATDLELETVQGRLAETIADQITLQLASYFSTHPETKPG
jgi:LPS-assembly lipoprotein